MTVRVLIVDDSGFFRRRLSEIINTDPRLSVVGMAQNGKEAIELVKELKPDVITMDIEMPVMDGITAVRKIMAIQSTPILMLSTWTTVGAKSTLDALDAGAVDYMPKQFKDISNKQEIVNQQICQRLVKIAKSVQAQPSMTIKPRIKASTPSFSEQKTKIIIPQPLPRTTASPSRVTVKQPLKLVAIGTSTGGPVALQKVLTQLPASFPYPLLLIQHMPGTFTQSFAERLNEQCHIKVKQAEDGDLLQAGTAYLAPGGMQMLLKGMANKPKISIQTSPPSETYKPCIDLTFESIAKIYPKETLAIILTGMGSDGREGCRELRKNGTVIWAQDKASSTIYGMPDAVAKAGLTDEILDIVDIGHHLARLK